MKDFCKEFGFELVDGTLALAEDNLEFGCFRCVRSRAGTKAQSRVFHTVTKQRRHDFGVLQDSVLVSELPND